MNQISLISFEIPKYYHAIDNQWLYCFRDNLKWHFWKAIPLKYVRYSLSVFCCVRKFHSGFEFPFRVSTYST